MARVPSVGLHAEHESPHHRTMLRGQELVSACGCPMVRRTVTDYNLYPCRRANGPLPGNAGEVVLANDGASIEVVAEVVDGRVADVVYRASSCATLVAYAEVLGEMVIGLELAEAMRITPQTLVSALPGVPIYRQERAVLTVRAWWSALARWLEARSDATEGEALD